MLGGGIVDGQGDNLPGRGVVKEHIRPATLEMADQKPRWLVDQIEGAQETAGGQDSQDHDGLLIRGRTRLILGGVSIPPLRRGNLRLAQANWCAVDHSKFHQSFALH